MARNPVNFWFKSASSQISSTLVHLSYQDLFLFAFEIESTFTLLLLSYMTWNLKFFYSHVLDKLKNFVDPSLKCSRKKVSFVHRQWGSIKEPHLSVKIFTSLHPILHKNKMNKTVSIIITEIANMFLIYLSLFVILK